MDQHTKGSSSSAAVVVAVAEEVQSRTADCCFFGVHLLETVGPAGHNERCQIQFVTAMVVMEDHCLFSMVLHANVFRLRVLVVEGEVVRPD